MTLSHFPGADMQSSTENDAWNKVRDWTITGAEADARSPTSQLTGQCVVIFAKLLKEVSDNPSIPKKIFRLLEKSSSSLTLWDSGYGMSLGKLDEAIAQSRTLKRSILQPLVSISTTLTERFITQLDLTDKSESIKDLRALERVTAEAKTSIHEGYKDAPESDESDSDGSVLLSSDWDEIVEDLWTDIRCLLALDPLIKSPAPDIIRRSEGIEKQLTHLKPHLPYIDKINSRFPKADENLIDRLASANYTRYCTNVKMREENHAKRQDLLVEAWPSQSVSKFHDSALGSSVHTGSIDAETVMSYRQNGQSSVAIPPLTAEAKRGIPFECVACGNEVKIMNNSAWKKHLYLDLRPWICHEPACGHNTELFSNHESWIQHLAIDHSLEPEWSSFQCPLCFQETGDGRAAISKHLGRHLEEISLAVLPRDVDSDDEHDPTDEKDSKKSLDVTKDADIAASSSVQTIPEGRKTSKATTAPETVLSPLTSPVISNLGYKELSEATSDLPPDFQTHLPDFPIKQNRLSLWQEYGRNYNSDNFPDSSQELIMDINEAQPLEAIPNNEYNGIGNQIYHGPKAQNIASESEPCPGSSWAVPRPSSDRSKSFFNSQQYEQATPVIPEKGLLFMHKDAGVSKAFTKRNQIKANLEAAPMVQNPQMGHTQGTTISNQAALNNSQLVAQMAAQQRFTAQQQQMAALQSGVAYDNINGQPMTPQQQQQMMQQQQQQHQQQQQQQQQQTQQQAQQQQPQQQMTPVQVQIQNQARILYQKMVQTLAQKHGALDRIPPERLERVKETSLAQAQHNIQENLQQRRAQQLMMQQQQQQRQVNRREEEDGY